MKTQEHTTQTNPPIIALSKWREQSGISTPTCWRMRRKGWLVTTNICGRLYLTSAAVADFTRRAEAGEFAKEHKAPKRTKGGAQ